MHLLVIAPEILVTGLLLLGAAFVLCMYHVFLYTQYKEMVVIAYSVYLFSLAAYIAVYLIGLQYYPEDPFAFIHYIKESTSLMTVLGYTYFLYFVLEEWHKKYHFFFRSLRVIMIVMSGYCIFSMAAGFLQLRGVIITVVLPYGSRIILLAMAIIAAFIFFPLMKNRFLRLIKLGSSIYLLVAALIVLTIVVNHSKVFGIDNILLFFSGVFIDIIIFSIAMAYKVKSVLAHIIEIRQKISQDLHDDIGASLSSLQIYGVIAENTFRENPEKAMEMIGKIAAQSKTVMENMGDLVWSMKTNDGNTTSLETKIKNYSVELLGENSIDFKFTIAPAAEAALKNATARKNILLIIKEALNNITKYSKASQAQLLIDVVDKELELRITDNGIGFDVHQKKLTGNGLQNMTQRATELGGHLLIESGAGSGTRLMASFPLKSL